MNAPNIPEKKFAYSIEDSAIVAELLANCPLRGDPAWRVGSQKKWPSHGCPSGRSQVVSAATARHRRIKLGEISQHREKENPPSVGAERPSFVSITLARQIDMDTFASKTATRKALPGALAFAVSDGGAVAQGEAAALAAWSRHGKLVIVQPPTYLKAIADLSKQTKNSPLARQAFDRELLRLARTSTEIFTPKLPKARAK